MFQKSATSSSISAKRIEAGEISPHLPLSGLAGLVIWFSLLGLLFGTSPLEHSRAWAGDSKPKIPSSARSRKAIKKVKPELEKALAEKGLHFGAPIFLRIFKESSELELFVEKDGKFHLFRTYPICYFSGSLGPKTKQGDGQAPEGFYFVSAGRLNPYSSYHLSFDLGYPNHYERALGRTGGLLMVHGNCVSIGCYAMTDEKIEEIYALVDAALRAGQPFFRVHAFPFRMTEERLKREKDSKWFDFWSNLKTGYDLFESSRRPPDVSSKDGRYTFEPG